MMPEAEILTAPIYAEISSGQFTLRASRKHLGQARAITGMMRQMGIELRVEADGLYCHSCHTLRVFPDERSWTEHNQAGVHD